MTSFVLGIDTASSACSICILDADQVLYEAALNRSRSHAEHLITLIEHGLYHCDLHPEQIDLVSVSKGPGSYTGLRIGVSTAKGLAYACDAALVGVSSLEALAASVVMFTQSGDLIIPAFDARRDEVYAAIYKHGMDGLLNEILPASKHPVGNFSEFLHNGDAAHCWLAGDGSSKCRSAFNRHPKGLTTDLGPVRSTAVSVAQLGLRRFETGEQDDVITFEPAYLNAFQARKGSSIFERLPK